MLSTSSFSWRKRAKSYKRKSCVLSFIIVFIHTVKFRLYILLNMTTSLFVSSGYRATLRKLCAGFLMLSLNLTGGVGALFLTAEVAYAAPLIADSFGTGGTVQDIPLWDESETFASSTVAQNPSLSSDDTVSPDFGRFAKIGEDDYICRIVDGRGSAGFTLSYLWRGDPDAEDENGNRDYGVVEVRKGASCTANDAWTNINTHKLDAGNNDIHEAWAAISGAVLGSSVDDAKFALRFRSESSSAVEHLRIDGVSVQGEPIVLTVLTSGNGAGTVTGAGINCPGDCTEATTNTTTLTAAAIPGSTFAGWSGGGCSGIILCAVTMNVAKSVTATFTVNSHIVTAVKAGNGNGTITSTPAGIICGVDCDEAFTYGTFVTLSASPMTGSTFTGWTGDCAGATCSVTVNAAKSVVGTFTLDTHTLTVSTTGIGSVSSLPVGISCGMGGGTCNNSFNFGEVVTLTPVADTGYTFSSWGGACVGTGACAVTMNAARNVVANFVTLPPVTCPQGQTGTPPNCVTPPLSCVANTSTMTRVSNTTDVKVGTPTGSTAVAVGFIHTAWTSLMGSTWIWSESPITNPATDPIESFFDVFTVVGTPTGGTLTIAGDNTFDVYMNGTLIGQDTSGTTYGGVITISTGATLVAGQNTLEIRVKNWGVGSTEGNPAGLLYKLTVNKNACVPANVTVTKVVVGGESSTSSFPLFLGEMPVTSGVAVSVARGTHTVSETNTDENYTPSYSGDCVASEGNSLYLSNIQDLVAKRNALRDAINVSPQDTAGNAIMEGFIIDIDGKIDAILGALSGTMTVASGASASCTITNTYSPTVVACNPDVNLIENAGFEAPISLENGNWGIIPFTNSALKWLGAFVNPTNTNNLGLEIQQSAAGAPAEGLRLAELDGYHPTKIWQSVVTKPGYDYALTFKYSPRPGTALGNNVLEVRKDGLALGAQISRGSASSSTEWSTETRTFLADGNTTSIEFADMSAMDDSLGTYLDDVRLSCVGLHVPKTTIVATKVVCDDEADLPNWSYGSSTTIDANTAINWVNQSGGECRLEKDWKFEWAQTSVTNFPSADYVGEAGAGWTALGPTNASGVATAQITNGAMSSIWMREVLQSGFIPFTLPGTNSNVSAEMYCNGDVKNYDNLDYAQLGDGTTAYCVAFNAPKVVLDTTMSLTVIKHVINDNGGTKEADDFTLHVRQPAVDMCTNEFGMQETVPHGMYREDGMCFPYSDNVFNTVVDWFSVKTAYAFIALFSQNYFPGDERGTVVTVSHETDYIVTEDADALYATTMSVDCTGHIAPGQHKTCTVTNNDIAPVVVPPGGGGGSSTFDYWGCTNPSAPNFNALANRDDNSCIIGGGNGGGSGTTTTQGEVAGASTTEPELALPSACVANPYLRDFMKMGKKNDPEQVKLLQTFLNEFAEANLPVSGIFGPQTKKAVKKLQKANHTDIIQPWIDAGYNTASIKEGTGIVYKTTKYFINKKKCAELMDAMPELKGDQGMTN